MPAFAAESLPILGDAAGGELSPLMERKLGEEIMHDIRRDPDYLDDAPLLEYLNNFGAILLAERPDVRGQAAYDFGFFGVRDPRINAFALPGGFIGVHSALILAAQSESQLASVLAHEIGHVAQRHIARMIGAQKQDALLPLASVLLAALAARSSGDAAAGIMMGGQGLAMQRQLNFSRDAEREADRIGLQILQDGGFDTSGMVGFFARMQTATRNYSENLPPYLLSHPLTTERIADIEARIRGQRYKQRADSLDFYLIRARVRVLQDSSVQGLRDATSAFENQLLQKTAMDVAAAHYGLAFIAQKQGQLEQAEKRLQQARRALPADTHSAVLAAFGIDLKLAERQPQQALALADAARAQFPLSRGIARQYGTALIEAGRADDATRYLRDQVQLYRQEPELQQLLAKSYAAQGKQALQHLALAESYALSGALPSALEQLKIARRAPDSSFYEQAIIDARERELQAQWREQLEQSKKSR
ncbi:MAG TPA: M48 family metalloprotease [Burkholderiaceae bacterium]|nr:M48 family metalloprotease [Burkholderiaceae bacterium]